MFTWEHPYRVMGYSRKNQTGIEDVKQNCENYENFQVSVKKEVKLPGEIK